MRFIVSSDWHIDAVTAGVRRFGEHFDYAQALESLTRSREVGLVLLTGDFFDPGTMASHRCEAFLFDVVGRLSSFTRVVLIAGNHDVVDGGEQLVTTLSAMRAAVRTGYGDGAVTVVEEPGLLDVAGVRVLCLPYVSRSFRHLYAQSAIGALVKRAAHLGSETPRPLLVAGHLTVAGADLGSESEEFARGSELDFPAEQIAQLNPKYAFNGHYHKPQTVRLGGLTIVIPGSPQRLTFAESGHYAKGFIVGEI